MVIQVVNFSNATVVNYSLVLLKAKLIPPCSCHSVTANNESSGHSQVWPVNRSLLKCMVPLKVGSNCIRLHCSHNAVDISITFKPSQRQNRVRLIYIIARNSDGTFQGPENEDRSVESAIRRIRLGALVLQSATAELLFEAGLGRRTFQFVVDEEEQPVVDKFICSMNMEETHRLSCDQLWMKFARELVAKYRDDRDTVKWMCFMAFTRYFGGAGPLPRSHQEVMDRTKGHCALGGGGLALFGTGNLYSWAESLSQLPSRLHDNRRVDRRRFMDDSAFRGTYWSNYATGLGATLHELGHTFDLSHTSHGIMQRGGDDINLLLSYPPVIAGTCRQCSGHSDEASDFQPPHDARPLDPPSYPGASRYLQFESDFVPVQSLPCKDNKPGQDPNSTALYLSRPAPHDRNGYRKPSGMRFGFCDSFNHQGQAAFARSSAILLAFHRWFRDDIASQDFCLRISRTELLADKGLRTVEFIADGVVAAHWEYTHDPPPTMIPLGTSVLRQLCPDVDHLVVAAEDDEGHVYKARVRIDQFGESPVLSPA